MTTHPALPQPELWKYTLSCGCTYNGGKVPDLARPVMCKQHGDGTGVMVSIIRVEKAG